MCLRGFEIGLIAGVFVVSSRFERAPVTKLMLLTCVEISYTAGLGWVRYPGVRKVSAWYGSQSSIELLHLEDIGWASVVRSRRVSVKMFDRLEMLQTSWIVSSGVSMGCSVLWGPSSTLLPFQVLWLEQSTDSQARKHRHIFHLDQYRIPKSTMASQRSHTLPFELLDSIEQHLRNGYPNRERDLDLLRSYIEEDLRGKIGAVADNKKPDLRRLISTFNRIFFGGGSLAQVEFRWDDDHFEIVVPGVARPIPVTGRR